MLPLLVSARERDIKMVVVTRPATDFREKDRASLEETLSLLHGAGVGVVLKSSIHQKFAIFDQKIVWYGSINLLSFGRSEESIMRLENSSIAEELLGSIQHGSSHSFAKADRFCQVMQTKQLNALHEYPTRPLNPPFAIQRPCALESCWREANRSYNRFTY